MAIVFSNRPDVVESDARLTSITNQLDTVLARSEFSGDYQKLLTAVSPSCAEFILECVIANQVMNGKECCRSLFDPTPTFNQYG
jgi:hypothetical protein